MIAINTLKERYGTDNALVVLCCRVSFGTATPQEIQKFIDQHPVNWPSFLIICRNHRIRIMIYRMLSGLNIPLDIQVIIREESQALIIQNWQQSLEMARLLALLAASGIQAIPYKGSAYAQQFYGDLISRESSDIDLIIHPKDLDKIIPIMALQGYHNINEKVYDYLGDRYFDYYKDFGCDKWKDGEREFYIEFHWAITENVMAVNPSINKLAYQIDQKIAIANQQLDVLNKNVHFLFILIHHAVKDVFNSLKEIIDIAQIANQKSFNPNWDLIVEQLEDLELKNTLALGNQLSEDLFGLSLTVKAGKIAGKKYSKFFEMILSDRSINPHDQLGLSLHLRRLDVRDTFKAKIKYLIALIKDRFVPSVIDIRLISVPRAFFFLYYFIKPIRTLLMIGTGKRYK